MIMGTSNNHLIKVGGLEKEKAEQHLTVWLLNYNLVGAAGFEPATSCSQGRRANQAALRPEDISVHQLM